jgi:hypothetical protein
MDTSSDAVLAPKSLQAQENQLSKPAEEVLFKNLLRLKFSLCDLLSSSCFEIHFQLLAFDTYPVFLCAFFSGSNN